MLCDPGRMRGERVKEAGNCEACHCSEEPVGQARAVVRGIDFNSRVHNGGGGQVKSSSSLSSPTHVRLSSVIVGAKIFSGIWTCWK